MATGIHAGAVAEEFLEHATDEQGHVDKIAERITQLRGEPDLDPKNLTTRSHSEYVEGKGLIEEILANEEDQARPRRAGGGRA